MAADWTTLQRLADAIAKNIRPSRRSRSFWAPALVGCQFNSESNHHPVRSITGHADINRRRPRWRVYLGN